MRFSLSSCGVFISLLLLCGTASAGNNIEFLDKELIRSLNHGIYEVVTPKLKSDKITYEKELPLEQLDFSQRNEEYYSIGTAFFINEKELMTAEHVFGLMYFSLRKDFFIRNAEGQIYPVNNIQKYSTRRDMVVFDLKKYPEKITPLRFNQNVEIGDTVFSAGNALGEGIAYRAGQVASFTPERQYGKWNDIRFSSPSSPGNSGGPLLNVQGEVIGVIVKGNRSENYNIAVPISEIDNLSDDEADCYARNIRVNIQGTNETLVKNWSYTIPLPATVDEIRRQGQNDLDTFYKKLRKELTERVKENNLPNGERFRYYLRHQAPIQGFAAMTPDINFKKWNAIDYAMEKEALTEEQNVYHGRSSVYYKRYASFNMQAMVEKPADLDQKTFLDAPKIILDTLLKAVPYFRYVGSERIRITSFGEPEETTAWRDSLGRKWTSSLWYVPYVDRFLYSHCLPYPKGVLCNIIDDATSVLKLDHFSRGQEACDELAVGYKGEIDDWIEYLSLGKEYLPTFFQQVDISRDNHRLKVKMKDFSFDVTNQKIKGDSTLRLHLGYANDQLLAEDLVLFSLFPQKGNFGHYRIKPFFEPSPFSSDSYIRTWNEIINSTGDFSGRKVSMNRQTVIHKTALRTERTITAPHDQKIKKVFTVGCYYNASTAEKENIEQDCEQFFQDISFTDQ